MVAPRILTQSGRYFDLSEPDCSQLWIDDIAHALSHLCRFAGHTRAFYSVAQHSLLVSRIVPPEHARAALLHDAAEAFLGDISTPLKAMLPEFARIERRVEHAVLSRFGIALPLPECIKQADLVLLATERRDLMVEHDSRWPIIDGIARLPYPIIPMTSMDARAAFIERYRELTFQAREV